MKYPKSSNPLDHDSFHALRRLDEIERMRWTLARALIEGMDQYAKHVREHTPDAPRDEWGEPVRDPSEYAEALEDHIHGEWDDATDCEVAAERLFRIGVHHTIEVFMKVVAADAWQGLKSTRPRLDRDKFNPLSWYERAGIKLESLPGAARLFKLRRDAGLWKHRGDTYNWLTSGRPDHALLGSGEDEPEGLEQDLVAAREFIPALVNEVDRLINRSRHS
jgi:hypothetical protein